MEVTSINVGSIPASPTVWASSQMVKATAQNCENTLLSTRVAIHFCGGNGVRELSAPEDPGEKAGWQDAALYGRQDACRHRRFALRNRAGSYKQ
jgi:hypothetical protein